MTDISDILQQVGARLRTERERLGLNQADFGRAGGINRSSQAEYEGGKRPCTVAYLGQLAAIGVDASYVVTGERAAGSMPADVAEYAELAPQIAGDHKAALLAMARALATRESSSAKRVTPQPIALPPAEALERGYLGILAASRNMDEAALARELAMRLPTLLDVLKGPLTIEQGGDGAAEAPPIAHPERRRA